MTVFVGILGGRVIILFLEDRFLANCVHSWRQRVGIPRRFGKQIPDDVVGASVRSSIIGRKGRGPWRRTHTSSSKFLPSGFPSRPHLPSTVAPIPSLLSGLLSRLPHFPLQDGAVLGMRRATDLRTTPLFQKSIYFKSFERS